MTLKHKLRVYRARWVALEAIQRKERISASMELRWRQLNSAYALAKGLGLLQPDPSDAGVFERWAKIKVKAASLHPKV
jgi:hypothetical protein